MYFWKIEALKQDIKSNHFYEKDRFSYAFIFIALSVIGMEAMMYAPIEDPNFWDTINSASNIVIPIVGTLWAFKANGGAKGVDFLGRFFSISFVVTIRFLSLFIPMFLLLIAYYINAFPEDEAIVSTPWDTIPFIIWFALLYFRICHHIAELKNV